MGTRADRQRLRERPPARYALNVPTRVLSVPVAAIVAAVVAVTLLAACSGTRASVASPRTLSDAPSRIDLSGVESSATVTLRHAYGIMHHVTADGDAVQPPLLIDGTWELEVISEDGTTTTRLGHVTIGDDTLTEYEAPAQDVAQVLLGCWTGAEGTNPRATTPEGVRCTQTLITGVAAREGYDTAAEAIELARAGLGSDQNLWGWYCNIAGDAAATGAVLGGADGRTLIREKASFCDYSVLHGVGSVTALLHQENLIEAVTAVCAADPRSNLPEIARTSQCWHGAGMGIARITRLDMKAGERFCAQAPEVASSLNCIEGLFAFTRTYLLRGESATREWPELAIDGAACNTLDGDSAPELFETCYRSSAQTLLRDITTTETDSVEVRRLAIEDMRATCHASADTHAAECWSGMGTLVATALHPDLDDRMAVRSGLDVCSEAPESRYVERCYERAALGLLRNDQLVTGLELEELVTLLPPELQDVLRERLLSWSQSLGGRSN
jgi:hypothetical protein